MGARFFHVQEFSNQRVKLTSRGFRLTIKRAK